MSSEREIGLTYLNRVVQHNITGIKCKIIYMMECKALKKDSILFIFEPGYKTPSEASLKEIQKNWHVAE